jgi:sporulation related protein
MKPGRSRLLWVGLPVITVFTVFVAIVWLAYQENARVPAGEPPLIRAIAAPYKRAPDDPGGRQVADQGAINQLLRDDPGPAQPERVLPLPEEPRTPIIGAPSRGETAPPAAVDSGEVPPTTAGVSATPPDTPAQSAGTADDADATREAEAALARLLANVGPSAEQPAAAERSTPATPDPVVDVPATRPDPPPSTTAPTIVRRDAPPAPASVDAPSREADEALTRLLAEVAGLPADVSPESPERPQAAAAERPQAVAAIAPADPVESPRTMGPGFRVQLAAVRAQDDARRAWADLAGRLGSLVADYEPFYERAETVNGVFYRIQLGPFASEQTADRLCVEVQRRNASCFVVVR